jgi:hypothetical protein
MRRAAWTVLFAVALFFAAGAVDAVSYFEIADAGPIPDAAQVVAVAGTVDILLGRLEHAFDVDLYRLVMTNAQTFSVTAVPTVDGVTDPQLFVFDEWGHGVAGNDDWLASPQPQLPVGTFLGMPAGEYLIGISAAESDPIGAFGEIFSESAAGVNVPVGVSRIDVVLGWSFDFSATGGNYLIMLSGAAGIAPVLVGDYNANGVVDAADYVVWRNMLGQSASSLPADGDGDGVVDGDDWSVWRAQFAEMAASGVNNAAVPEPVSLCIVGLVLLMCSTKIRSRNSINCRKLDLD